VEFARNCADVVLAVPGIALFEGEVGKSLKEELNVVHGPAGIPAV